MKDLLDRLRYYGYFRRNLYFYPKFIAHKLRSSLLDKRQLLFAEISLDNRCNFTCWHCSAAEFMTGERKLLDYEQLETTIKKLQSVGVLSVCYVGGEPTIRTDLPDVIRMTHRHRIAPSIITNASLLTPGKVDELFDAGLANLGFSLQSMNAETHDHLVRHRRAHRKMIEMIEYCVEKGYTTSICVVPTNENLANGDFDNLITFATQHGIRVNANLPAPVGEISGEEDSMLTRKSLDILYDRYFNLPNFSPDFKASTKGASTRCPMVEDSIFIKPDGIVTPCAFVQVPYGNILHEELPDILTNMEEDALISDVRKEDQCPIAMDRKFAKKVSLACADPQTAPTPDTDNALSLVSLP